MKRIRWIFLVLLLGLAGAVGWNQWRSAHSTRNLVLYGNVDIREVSLGFRVGGKVRELLKDEGDVVQPGELIARLDDLPYVREVEESEAQARSIRARFEMLKRGYREEEIAQARAVLKERETTWKNAETLRGRKKDLAQRKVITPQELDDATATTEEALARLNSARAALSLMEAGYRKEEIAQAEADLAKAEASLAAARLRREDSELKSPSAGVIMTRAVESGAIVQAGATVFNLSLNSPVWVRLYIHEPELGRIHPGQKVWIHTDARPNQPYEGQVGYISPRAEFTPKSVETEELRTLLVYRLRVVVNQPDGGLRQGMPVTARL